jgi:nucleotide-binding universal stress UspA family protein
LQGFKTLLIFNSINSGSENYTAMKIQKILIGIDDSAYARKAAAYGFDIARSYSATVGLVHIIEPVVFPADPSDSLTGMPVGVSLGFEQKELIELQIERSAAVIEGIKKECAQGLEVIAFTEFDNTADGIIACAGKFGADMIVLGTHKRSGFDRLIMGSIAESVLRHSTIPVLIVPFTD